MVDKILDFIVEFIDENNFIASIVFLIIGALLLYFQLSKEKPLDFKNSSILGWNADINMWVLIFMSIIFGLILYFN
jgi:hypothetical protein